MRSGDPIWTEQADQKIRSEDPLGMNRVRTSLVSELLPGITTQSPRARYISHHLWAIRDTLDREEPDTVQAFYRELYQRERVFMLASAQHSNTDETNWDHSGIVGVRTGRDILANNDAMIPLDFRSVSASAGGYGSQYRGPMQSLGVVAQPDDAAHNHLTDLGQAIADAYAEVVRATGFDQLVTQEEISRQELAELTPRLCLCQVAAENAPDREPLRDLFLGRERDPGDQADAHSRRRSLRLILNLATRIDEEASLNPGDLLDSCYYGKISTDRGYITADFPDDLTEHAARWKMLRAHDYLAYATETILEAWLAYLEAKSPDGGTIAGFKAQATSENVITRLAEATDIDSLSPKTPISTVIGGIWPDTPADPLANPDQITPVPMVHPASEHSIDADLSRSVAQADWADLHAQWPRLVLALVLRFASTNKVDTPAWEWLRSHTGTDLSPARLRDEVSDRADNSLKTFIEWFIDAYVIERAEQVRRERAGASERFRGWFQKSGAGWQKLRDYSAGHWSARFSSSVSLLRDLALLDPDPDRVRLTPAGQTTLNRPLEAATDD